MVLLLFDTLYIFAFILILQFSWEKRSILAVGDITEIIPEEEADIAVLEEPEHLTWYHHGMRWKTKFRLVIGIVHTNYLEYVRRERNGQLQAFLLKYMNSWVVNIYCHKVCWYVLPALYSWPLFSYMVLRISPLLVVETSIYVGIGVWFPN